MNQKSGSFTVDPRLQRNFTVLTMYTPTLDIIKTIFGSILGGHLSQFEDKVFKISDKLVDGMIYVFNKLLKDTRFSPSSRKFHYQFNFRELAKITEGIMRSLPTNQYYKGGDKKIVKLWAHECKRVFEDRFINDEDIN